MIDLYSLGAVNGLLLAVLLFWMPKQSGANRVMAMWCMLLSLHFIGNFIYKDQTINVFSFLIGWTYFFPAAYGGLLFLYCQKLLNQLSIITSVLNADLWIRWHVFSLTKIWQQ